MIAYRVIDHDSGRTIDTLHHWYVADRLAEYLQRARRVNAVVQTIMVPNY